MKAIGFLGPPGTFTDLALHEALEDNRSKIDTVAYANVPDAIEAVERGEVGLAFVPIENSTEGSVNVTLDTLAFHSEMRILGETVMKVRQNLLAVPGSPVSDVKTVYSHPHARAQCRGFISGQLKGTEIVITESTTTAAEKARKQGAGAAAIGTAIAAELYGLEVIAPDIQDNDENVTRFVFIGPGEAKPTGEDKTSIVCWIHQDRPGSLLQILQEFAYRYVNLTKIESRPAKQGLGDYVFFIDLEGHAGDEIVAGALKCLGCKIKGVKVLGSYPKAGNRQLLQTVLTQLI